MYMLDVNTFGKKLSIVYKLNIQLKKHPFDTIAA